jgi:hypothetical protein
MPKPSPESQKREILNGNLACNVLYLSRLKQTMPELNRWIRRAGDKCPSGSVHACINLNKGHQAMTKSLEVITEAIRNPKHPFRKVDNQPKKPLKHRYERRKIKEYLNLSDWVSGEAT